MVENSGSSSIFNSIEWFGEYHSDVVAALKLYFKPSSNYFQIRSHISSVQSVQLAEDRLLSYLKETDLRSSFAILSSIEAAFRQDYEFRCSKRLKDPLSREFRTIYKLKQSHVNLDQDLFDAWNKHTSETHQLIEELRGAFRFRHWLAHGRYWTPKLGRKYDFNFLYLLAKTVFEKLPLSGSK